MVFSAEVVVAVASLSAELCQYVAFNPERFSSREVLDLICCLPLRRLGRLALCLCSVLCFPSPHRLLRLSPSSSSSSSAASSSSSSSSDEEQEADYVYDPHSD